MGDAAIFIITKPLFTYTLQDLLVAVVKTVFKDGSTPQFEAPDRARQQQGSSGTKEKSKQSSKSEN